MKFCTKNNEFSRLDCSWNIKIYSLHLCICFNSLHFLFASSNGTFQPAKLEINKNHSSNKPSKMLSPDYFQGSFRNVRRGGYEGVARNDKSEPGDSHHTWTCQGGVADIGKHNEPCPLISRPGRSIRYLEQDVQTWTLLIGSRNTFNREEDPHLIA